MARHGVTYQAVVNAAEILVQQQQIPTLDRIRAIIGSGSNTTLALHFNQWKLTKQTPAVTSEPNKLPAELMNSLTKLWERQTELADDKIAALRKQHSQEINQLHEEIKKYKSNNIRWQKLYESWLDDKKTTTAEKLHLEKELLLSQTKCASYLQSADEKQTRIDELHRLHKQTQLNLEHFRASARQQQQMDHEKHTQLQYQAELIIKELREENSQATQQIHILQQQLAEVQAQIQINQSTCTQLNKANEFLEQANHKLVADHEVAKLHWQDRYEKLANEIKQYTNKMTNLEKDHAQLQHMYTTANEQAKKLAAENAILIAEKWALAQEKSQLQGELKQLVSA